MNDRATRLLLRLAILLPLFVSGPLPLLAASAQQPATPAPVTAENLADPDGAFIDIDGASIYYVAAGPADGPAVVLLHGVLDSTLTWTATIETLAGAGYRVVAFDQPPFGLSAKSPDLDYSVAGQADRAVALMAALGIERAALVGHSGGGPLAGEIAERYPERVSQLVLVAPAYLGLLFVAPAAGAATATHPAAMMAGSPPPGRQPPSFTLFPVLFDPTNDPASPADQARLRDAIAAERAATPPRAAAGADPFRFTRIEGWEAGLLAHGRAWLNDPALLGPDPAAITAPVLLVWGETDQSAISRQMAALLPEAELIIIPGVGHFPMEEAPEPFNRGLLAFLAD